MDADHKSTITLNEVETERESTAHTPEKPAYKAWVNIPDQANAGFCMLDRQMNYTFLNQKGGELLGRKPEDLVGKNYWEEHAESIDPSLAEACQHALETQTPLQYENYHPPSGRWFVNRIFPSNQGLVIFFTDITERKQGEAADQKKVEGEHTIAEIKLAEEDLETWVNAPLRHQTRPVWLRYGVALMATVIAILLRKLFEPVLGGDIPLVTLFGAVAFSVWYGGIGPALLATFVGYLGTAWFIVEPLYGLRVRDLIGLGLFLLSNTIVMAIGEALRRAQRHAQQSARVAVERQRQAENQLREQKRAEAALVASQAELQQVADHTLQGLARCSRDLNYLFVNRAYAALFNLTPAQITGKPMLEIMGAQAFSSIQPHVERVLKGEQVTYETQLPFPGGLRWLHITYLPNWGTEGQVIGWFASITDITERKQTEERLREGEHRFSVLFQATPFALLLSKLPDYTIVEVNEAFLQMFGVIRDEVLGKTELELNLVHDPQVRAHMLQLLQTQQALRNFEYPTWTKSGARLHLSLNVNALRFNGETYLLVALEDISARKQAETRAQLLGRLSTMIQQTTDPEELLYAASALTGEHLRVQRSFFVEIDQRDDRGFIRRDYVQGQPSVAGEYRLSDYSPETAREISMGQTIVNHDAQADPRTAAYYEKSYGPHGERAYVAVPLLREGHWVAALWVSTDTPRAWRAEEVALLQTVAERTWLAVEKMRAYTAEQVARQQAEQFKDRTARLQQVTAALNKAADPAQLAELILEQGTLACEANAGMLVEVLADKQAIQILAARGYPSGAVRPEPVPLAAPTPMSDCIRTGRAILLRSHQEFADQYPALAELRSGFGNEATAAIPLMIGDQVLGGLAFSFVEPRGFEQEEREFFLAVAGQCALGLERVRAQEALRASKAQLAAEAAALGRLNEASSRLWHIPSLQAGLEEMLAATIEMLGADMGYIQLLDAERGVLYIAVQRGFQAEVLEFFREVTTEDNSASGRALRTGERIVIKDVEQDVLYAPLHSVARAAGYRAVQATPLLGHNGTPLGMFSTYWRLPHQPNEPELRRLDLYTRQAADFIERSRYDEALRRSEARYRFIVENTSDGLWQLELTEPMPLTLSEDEQVAWYYRHAVMRECNQELARMYGYASVEEVLGLPLRVVMPPEKPANLALVQEFIRAGYRLVDVESHEVTKDGRELVFLNNLIGIFEEGKLKGEWGTNRDITERKRAEQALRQSEARFAQFMAYLPGLAWIKDLQGRYVYANASAEKVFTSSSRDTRIYGKTDEELFPPETARQFKQNDAQALAERAGLQVIETLKQTDGILHYSLVSKFPIPGPDGNPVLIGGTAFDITELREAEEALRESEQRLQALNASLDQKVKAQTAEIRRLASDLTKAEQRERHRLAQILHDDLQQQLYAIQLQFDLFFSDLGPHEAGVERRFSEIKMQVAETIAMTRHLSIDLSPPILHDEGLAQAIRWLIEQMQQQYDLHIELQANEIFALPNFDLQVLLYSCVRELLFNIVKHARVNRAFVKLQRSKDTLLIEVRDEGQGFEMGTFPPRAEDEGAGENRRTPSGFGLPTLRHRLSLFDGSLEITSQPNAGTQIKIMLPIYVDR